MYSKVDGLPDAPITEPNLPYQDGSKHFLNGPRIHEYHKEMHKYILEQVDDGREIMTVGEVGFGQDSVFKDYTSAAQGEIDMLFNFEHVRLGMGSIRYDLSLFNLKDYNWRFMVVSDSLMELTAGLLSTLKTTINPAVSPALVMILQSGVLFPVNFYPYSKYP